MRVSLAFHLIGLVLWVGGLVILPRILKGLAPVSGQVPEVVSVARRVFFGFIVSGFVIALGTGLFQFVEGGGASVYMKQGWFHTKLTFILVLLVATALLAAELARGKRGEALRPGRLLAVHAMSALSLIVITLFTFIGR